MLRRFPLERELSALHCASAAQASTQREALSQCGLPTHSNNRKLRAALNEGLVRPPAFENLLPQFPLIRKRSLMVVPMWGSDADGVFDLDADAAYGDDSVSAWVGARGLRRDDLIHPFSPINLCTLVSCWRPAEEYSSSFSLLLILRLRVLLCRACVQLEHVVVIACEVVTKI